MARRTFRVIGSNPEIKIGALIQEECDDGTQDYRVLNKKDLKFPNEQNSCVYSRPVVETQPDLFEEVFPIVPEWGTKEEVATFNKLLKAKK